MQNPHMPPHYAFRSCGIPNRFSVKKWRARVIPKDNPDLPFLRCRDRYDTCVYDFLSVRGRLAQQKVGPPIL